MAKKKSKSLKTGKSSMAYSEKNKANAGMNLINTVKSSIEKMLKR